MLDVGHKQQLSKGSRHSISIGPYLQWCLYSLPHCCCAHFPHYARCHCTHCCHCADCHNDHCCKLSYCVHPVARPDRSGSLSSLLPLSMFSAFDKLFMSLTRLKHKLTFACKLACLFHHCLSVSLFPRSGSSQVLTNTTHALCLCQQHFLA